MDIDICPPWWPNMLWWLLHHKKKPGDPPDPRAAELVNEILISLSTFTMAAQVQDRAAAAQMREIAGKNLVRDVQQLVQH